MLKIRREQLISMLDAENKKRAADYARSLYEKGWGCATSLYMAMCPYMGKNADPKPATFFNGGSGIDGNCGIINIAFLCLGEMYGSISLEQGNDTELYREAFFRKIGIDQFAIKCSQIREFLKSRQETEGRKVEGRLCMTLLEQAVYALLDVSDELRSKI
jgi:hypothetical protein